MPAPVRIELLGRVRAHRAGRTIERFRSHKTAGLLGYLALHLDRSQPRETLVELFWPEASARAGRGSLSRSLSSLRAQLEPPGSDRNVFIATQTDIALNPDSVVVDVREFEAKLDEADSTKREADRRRRLESALQPFPGSFMPAHYDDWVLRARERISDRALSALEELVDMMVNAGDARRALTWARTGTEADPLRESAHRLLMRIQMALGRASEARRQLEELRDLLARELGVDPDPETEAIVMDRPPSRTPIKRTRTANPPEPAIRTAITGSFERAIWTFVSLARSDDAPSMDLAAGARARGGLILSATTGECTSAFRSVDDALACALAAAHGPGVRAAVHVAEATLDVADPAGSELGSAPELTRWLSGAAHPGQLLCSEPAVVLASHDDELGVTFRELGTYEGPVGAQRVFRIVHELLTDEDRAVRARAVKRIRLPVPPTTFVGRAREIEELTALITRPDARLVTVLGLGGSGKTRLAIEAAGRSAGSFPGGVTFVPLVDVQGERRLAAAILEALEVAVPSRGSALSAILDSVNGTDAATLLLLDNLEHLLEPVTKLTDALLGDAPQLTILTTSRQPLSVSAERVLTPGPMTLPRAGASFDEVSRSDAVQLFVHRAQSVDLDFGLSPRNAESVRKICERVSGIPLGIELAAGRMQMLSATQLLSKLGKRLDVLATKRRDVPERHRTLDGTIDWSVSLLSPTIRRFLETLSVFPASFDVEAVEAVTEDPLALDHLSVLREHSLLQTDRTGEEPRFWMLDVVRRQVADRIGAKRKRELDDRHASVYAARVDDLLARPPGQVGFDVVRAFDADIEHYRRAVDVLYARAKSRAKGATDGLRRGLFLVSRLAGPWALRGRTLEARRWLDLMLALPGGREPDLARAMALSRAGESWLFSGDANRAAPYVEEAVTLFRALDHPQGLAVALNWMAEIARLAGDLDRARGLCEEGLAIFDRIGERQGQANASSLLGMIAMERGALDEAKAHFQAIVTLARDGGLDGNLASALCSLGNVAARRDDTASARRHFEEARAIANRAGAEVILTDVTRGLYRVAIAEGKTAEAETHAIDTFEIGHVQGQESMVRWALSTLAAGRASTGDAATAARLLGALSEVGHTPDSDDDDVDTASLAERLTPVQFARHVEWGRTASADRLIDLLRGS